MKNKSVIIFTVALLFGLTADQSLFARGGGGTGGSIGSGSMSRNNQGSNSTARQAGGQKAVDSDGDGTVNHLDPDYVRPKDGTGRGATDFKGSGSGTRVLDGTGPHGKNANTAQ